MWAGLIGTLIGRFSARSWKWMVWAGLLGTLTPGAARALWISGTVSDRSGAPVADALVVITAEDDSGARFTARSDAEGHYELPEASPTVPPTVVEGAGGVPEEFALLQNWPNPFNPGTQLGYRLDRAALVELDIYNVLGQRVRVLDRGYRVPGLYRFSWDGLDDAGRALGAGVYLYRLDAGGRTAVKRMVMVDGAPSRSGGAGASGGGVAGVRDAAGRLWAQRGAGTAPEVLYTVEVVGKGVFGYWAEHMALTQGQQYDIRVGRLGDGGGQGQGRVVGDVRTFTLAHGVSMEFVWIEPGSFLMGAPPWDTMASDAERPQHVVTISHGFWLGKYEITIGQWKGVTGRIPPDAGTKLNRPVNYVSWIDLHAFIDTLNEAAGDSVYRLPTEAEWEYACRAGTQTRWWFGNDEVQTANWGNGAVQLEDCAWYWPNMISGERPWRGKEVGQKLPNPWGLYDMYGNVSEWVEDFYGPYPHRPQVDPTGPATPLHGGVPTVVLRGGSYHSHAPHLRASYRNPHHGQVNYDTFADEGARLVRTP